MDGFTEILDLLFPEKQNKLENKAKFDLNIVNEKFRYDDFIKSFHVLKNMILDDFYSKDTNIEIVHGKKSVEMTASKLLINMIYWKPYVYYGEKIEKDDIWIIPDLCDRDVLYDRLENCIMPKFYNHLNKKNKIEELSLICSQIIRDLIYIQNTFSYITLNTFSLRDIIEMSHRNPEIKSIIHTKLDSRQPMSDIINELEHKKKRLKEAVKEDAKSALYPFIETGVYNDTQLMQSFVAVGPRSDAHNVILPHIVSKSYANGFDNVADYYVDCESTRLAMLLLDEYLGKSGYLSREFDLLCSDISIHPTIEDCGSKNYLRFKVESDKHLKLIHNKYRVLPNNKLEAIDYHKDKNLIGQEVLLRSVIGCRCDKSHVCKKCYGKENFNQLKINVGSLVSILFINPISQQTMSAKHALNVFFNKFENELFEKYFNIDEDNITLKPDFDYSNMKIGLNRSYVEELEEQKRNGIEDNDLFLKKLDFVRIVNIEQDPTTKEYGKVIHDFNIDSHIMLLSDEVLSEIKTFNISADDTIVYFDLKDFSPEISLFDLSYYSKNVSSYLQNIITIANSPSVAGKLSELVKERVMNMANIAISSSFCKDMGVQQIECIYRKLSRNVGNTLLLPDYDLIDPDLVILNLKEAIFTNALTDGIAYEYLGKQFSNPDLYEYDTVGINDPLYKVTQIHTLSNLKSKLKDLRVI